MAELSIVIGLTLRTAVTGTPKQQKEGIKELKTVLLRYLAPILGNDR